MEQKVLQFRQQMCCYANTWGIGLIFCLF